MEVWEKTVGYVRLSRDDDKKNYVSIENQKLMIERYAAGHDLTIERWYEDDGYSGYKFDRPALSRLIDDLNIDVGTVIAKDLSRIGRHNAKVLIMLEEFRERGKRLIIIDDQYDTQNAEEDEILGIKTWVNEKYIKDTSKKIKSVFRTRQKEGTLIINVPFGYKKCRNDSEQSQVEMIPSEAAYIRNIFDLYLQGNGCRKIACLLSNRNVPTPSMLIKKRYIREGRLYQRKISNRWNDAMVSAILKNDFYIGNLRLHKRARSVINGIDHRIPVDNQLLFIGHHAPIIDKESFDRVQEMLRKRMPAAYQEKKVSNHIFTGLLFCKDCGGRLSPITRKQNTLKRYYICSTYNNKGRRYCAHAHRVEETALLEYVYNYLNACFMLFGDRMTELETSVELQKGERCNQRKEELKSKITAAKHQLEALLKLKIKEVAEEPDSSELIGASYQKIQRALLSDMNEWKLELSDLEQTDSKYLHRQDEEITGINFIKALINKKCLRRNDFSLFINRIVVDQNGMPEIFLAHRLPSTSTNETSDYNELHELLNRGDEVIFLSIMNIIYSEERDFTSLAYLTSKLHSIGISLTKEAIRSYLNICRKEGILQYSGIKQRPYNIVISKEALADKIKNYISDRSARRNATDGI
ncbi:MAG: site-specific recombinase, invertase Pin-like protein [Herbinix sp.]|jgi:DNA invertase Pin-like site-specific DNA recombinase|nr:site-specific recombinase, invertase Pin-like protein [Herbinix sp.]